MEKGQGAIEYLLIIGAAVIIAVIVITLMVSFAGQGQQAAEGADVGGALEEGQCLNDCTFLGSNNGMGDSCEEKYPSTCLAGSSG